MPVALVACTPIDCVLEKETGLEEGDRVSRF